MNASRPRRPLLLAALLAAVGLAAQPASAVVECTISGQAGEFQVRRVVVEPPMRGSSLALSMQPNPARIIDGSTWHMFAGAWVLRANTGDAHSYRFLDSDASFGPPRATVRWEDQQLADEPVPSTDVISQGRKGAYRSDAYIDPGTYYLIGFGAGDGDWSARLRMGGENIPCEPVEIDGRILAFDASHFEGGTHLMAPGVGHGEGLRLSYTNPYSYSVGGLYAHQPPPLPPARVVIETEATRSENVQTIRQIGGSWKSWTFTADYTGYPSDAPLIRVLQLDLPIGS